MTRTEAECEWIQMNLDTGCSCHLSPPCWFCENGFSLELNEYLDQYGPWDGEEDEAHESDIEAYDRAMRMVDR